MSKIIIHENESGAANSDRRFVYQNDDGRSLNFGAEWDYTDDALSLFAMFADDELTQLTIEINEGVARLKDALEKRADEETVNALCEEIIAKQGKWFEMFISNYKKGARV